MLAARLKQDPSLDHVAVLNEGIGGNHVLIDSGAPSALARLDRDVLAQDGASYVIVLESINDIGRLAIRARRRTSSPPSNWSRGSSRLPTPRTSMG